MDLLSPMYAERIFSFVAKNPTEAIVLLVIGSILGAAIYWRAQR